MITPILKDPKAHGGTLYTFPSASRDMTRAFSNSEYEFAFSHFACLNLPDFRYGSFESGKTEGEGDIKGIFLDDLYPYSIDKVNNLNTSLKWHLQSYVMNYEVAILNGLYSNNRSYDNEILRNPSERIFFNWLQKVNAIKIEGGLETLKGYGYDIDPEFSYNEDYNSVEELSTADRTQSYRIGNKLYTWKGGEWRYRILVGKTVQYIGTIDMVNNVDIDGDSFNEIYLNIPAGVGGSPNVYFENVEDDNYKYGEVISVDSEFIIGRNPEELGLTNDSTLTAIYDPTSDSVPEHSYKIDTGYCINFNDSLYGGGGGTGIESMNLSSDEDFEFNCVLIYYRIRKGNGSWYTNLYGVLFLEEVTISDFNTTSNMDDERGGYIQRYPKFKKGNSWGLKLDLKIDAQPDSQMELREKEYEDPNGSGAGMQMFTEALMRLNDCAKLFYEIKNENVEIKERIYTLENTMTGIDSVYNLRDEVSSLRTRVEMFQPSIYSLEGRISDMEAKVTKLETNLGYLINIVNTLKKGE
jgi:hypothetical protein